MSFSQQFAYFSLFFDVDHLKSLYWICYITSVSVLVLQPWGMWDLSFLNRDQTNPTPCTGSLNPLDHQGSPNNKSIYIYMTGAGQQKCLPKLTSSGIKSAFRPWPPELGRGDGVSEWGLPVQHMQRYHKLRFISSLRSDELALRLGSHEGAVRQGKTVDLTEWQSLSQHCRRARKQMHG